MLVYEKLLIAVIPNTLFILALNSGNKKNYPLKVIFRNKAAEELLDNHDLILSGDGENYEEPMISSETREPFDVLERIHHMVSNSREAEINNFQNMMVSVKDKSEQKHFDLKYGKINWNSREEILVILNDVSDNRKLVELRRMHKRKDLMLATVSHDLRTPLNGLLAHVEVARDSEKIESVRKALKIAIKSGRILQHMINDILDFSQITNKTLRLTNRVISVETVISNVSKLIKFQAKQKGLVFSIENFLDRKSALYADPLRVQQILINLLGNALKFTRRGKITLKITSHKSCDGEEELAKLSVIDTGQGIKDEDIPKLFRLFGKLEMSDYDNVQHTGVGLGLAISQNLALMILPNESGGGIKVRSVFGEGSEFYFSIPLITDDQNTEEFQENLETKFPDARCMEPALFIDDTNKSINFRKKSLENDSLIRTGIFPEKNIIRILVVDDDPVNLMVGERYCEALASELSITVESTNATNGKEAIELIMLACKEKKYFDIVLMDCNMPIMNGFEASKQIKQMVADKKVKELKIIACTANVENEDVSQCFQVGMDFFLGKPLLKSNFLSTVKKILRDAKRLDF